MAIARHGCGIEGGHRDHAVQAATSFTGSLLRHSCVSPFGQWTLYGLPPRKNAGEWCYDTRNFRISFGGHDKVVFINVLDNKNDVIP